MFDENAERRLTSLCALFNCQAMVFYRPHTNEHWTIALEGALLCKDIGNRIDADTIMGSGDTLGGALDAIELKTTRSGRDFLISNLPFFGTVSFGSHMIIPFENGRRQAPYVANEAKVRQDLQRYINS